MQTQCKHSVDLASIIRSHQPLPPGERIRPALGAIRLTVSTLARRLGVTRPHASVAINHRYGSDKLRLRVLELLNAASSSPIEYTDIWPIDWSKI